MTLLDIRSAGQICGVESRRRIPLLPDWSDEAVCILRMSLCLVLTLIRYLISNLLDLRVSSWITGGVGADSVAAM